MTVQGNVYLGSGFGGEQASDFQLSDDAESRRPGEFRDILGEIFMFFENFFPAMRWDFKKQVEEEEALFQLSANHGKTIVASPKVFSDELVQEMQPLRPGVRVLEPVLRSDSIPKVHPSPRLGGCVVHQDGIVYRRGVEGHRKECPVVVEGRNRGVGVLPVDAADQLFNIATHRDVNPLELVLRGHRD
jgi:hypothetical protein